MASFPGSKYLRPQRGARPVFDLGKSALKGWWGFSAWGDRSI